MSEADSATDILLVEDTSTDAELCIRTLKKHNLANRLTWVKDGAEALDFLFARGAYAGRDIHALPKVVLLDLRMPKVSGLEVIRQVRADERLKMVPIVVLTSSKEEPDVSESYRLGANAFVCKPVEFDDFAKTVAELGMFWLLINKPAP